MFGTDWSLLFFSGKCSSCANELTMKKGRAGPLQTDQEQSALLISYRKRSKLAKTQLEGKCLPLQYQYDILTPPKILDFDRLRWLRSEWKVRERKKKGVRKIRIRLVGDLTSCEGVSSASAPNFFVFFRSKISGPYTPLAVFLDRLSAACCISLTASEAAVGPFHQFRSQNVGTRQQLAIIGCI